jgi:hypothetical protein
MERAFSPGFRMSVFDCVVLAVGGALASYVATIHRPIGLAFAFVVLHFFLFCNVIRMARKLELIWTGLFVVLAAGTLSQVVTWPIVFGISLAGSLVLAIVEMRSVSYHGVGWQWINPHLPQWWAAQQSRELA